MQVLKSLPASMVPKHFGFGTLILSAILMITAGIRASDSLAGGPAAPSSGPTTISLAGQWAVQLDPKNIGESETISLGNAALGKTATQSSVANGGVASRAVDGNTEGRAVWRSVTETAASDSNPWWQVDLGQSYDISLIQIWNRTDRFSDKLSRFTVSILDSSKQVVWTRELNYYPNPCVTLDGANTKGQYVKIQLNGPGPLFLAEVMVFPWEPSSFVNVALKKEATQSSVGDNAPASRAVDGIADGDWAPEWTRFTRKMFVLY
jgi:hypothetical protein